MRGQEERRLWYKDLPTSFPETKGPTFPPWPFPGAPWQHLHLRWALGVAEVMGHGGQTGAYGDSAALALRP